MPTYTEQNFEDHIEEHLNQSGYRSLQSTLYDKSLCLIPSEVLHFHTGNPIQDVSEIGTPIRERHTAKTHAPY